jgi:hypothetical protein
VSIHRLIVVVPVLAGLVVTGSAVARMMPAQSVRDTVYQTCAHNGVHFNKQGHANCGLHKGWTQDGAPTSADQRGAHAGTTEPATLPDHGMPAHTSHKPDAPGHSADGHAAKSHGPAAHDGAGRGHSVHAHGGGHGSGGHGNGHHAG